MAREIEVRIAVAVDHEGRWYAQGRSGGQVDHGLAAARLIAHHNRTNPEGTTDILTHTVTARVPVPEPQEIEGEVERG